jgi:hypothetical protein
MRCVAAEVGVRLSPNTQALDASGAPAGALHAGPTDDSAPAVAATLGSA